MMKCLRQKRRRARVPFILCITLVVAARALTPPHHHRHGGRRRPQNSDLYMSSVSNNNNSNGLLSRRTFGIVCTASLGLITAGEVYARVASLGVKDDKIHLHPSTNIIGNVNVNSLTIIFHGAGGPDVYTDALVDKLKENGGAVVMVQWQDYSSNLLQASANGQVVGEKVAKRLLQASLSRIHVIGISVGAFAADSLVQQVKEKQPAVYIQETLLDPFGQSGLVDFGYGKRNFGKHADYAQQYLNTDDPVPFTNEPLENCVTYNVTSLRPTETFGHDWPLVYYGRLPTAGFVGESDKLQRGSLVQIQQ